MITGLVGLTVAAGLLMIAWSVPAPPAEKDDQESSTSLIPDEPETADEEPERAASAEEFPNWFGDGHPPRTLTIVVSVEEVTKYEARWSVACSLELVASDPLLAEFREGRWADEPDLLPRVVGEVTAWTLDQTDGTDEFVPEFAPRFTTNADAGTTRVSFGSVDPLDLPMTQALSVFVNYRRAAVPAISEIRLRVEGRGFFVAGTTSRTTPREESASVVELPVEAGASEVRVGLMQQGQGPDPSFREQLLAGRIARPAPETEPRDDFDEEERDSLYQAERRNGSLLTVLPALVPFLLALGAPPRPSGLSRLTRWFAAAAVPAVIVASIWIYPPDSRSVLAAIFLGVLPVLLIMLTAHRRGWLSSRGRWVAASAASVLLSIGCVVLFTAWNRGWEFPLAVIHLVIVAFWIPAFLAIRRLIRDQLRSARRSLLAALAISVVCAVVPVTLDSSEIYYSLNDLVTAATLLLGAGLFWLLAERGHSSTALADPAVRIYALALATIPVVVLPPDVRQRIDDWSILISAAVMLAGLFWLLPRERARRAAVLGGVSAQAHSQLLRREVHARVVLVGMRSLYHKAREALAVNEIDMAESDRRRKLLDSAEVRAANSVGLMTGGGRSPWTNGVAGAVIVLLLTLPVMIVLSAIPNLLWGTAYVGLDLDGSGPLAALVVLLFWGRWGIYGFLFGYLYPRLRGRDAMSKAAGFAAVALVAESTGLVMITSTNLLSGLQGEGWTVEIGFLGTVVAPGLMMAVGLGLAWERRLAREADLPWRRVRSMRGLRSLTAPVISVLVAVASSGASTLLGLFVEGPGK